MTRPPARRPWVAALAGLVLLAGASCARVPRAEADDVDRPVGEFALTERGGERVTQRDLLGKVWVASFQFTRCTGPCPQISRTMKRLQDELADRPDLLLVTFTVDPEHDDPDELRRFADLQGADPRRWLFLTGKPSEIYALLRNGFQVFAQPNTGAERRPGSEVAHDTHLVVVDRRGHVRGYFEGLPDPRLPDSDEEFEANLRRLRAKVDSLVYEPAPYLPRDLPRLNATLNALAAGLLLAGFAAVRARFLRLHAALMLTALGVSAVFLASYLYYHIGVRGGRPTRFAEQAAGAPAWVAYVYMAVLLTHTALAAVAAPLAVYTAYQGLRGRIERHRRVARWALPVWLYVSVTGVVVYWMLYRLYPPA